MILLNITIGFFAIVGFLVVSFLVVLTIGETAWHFRHERKQKKLKEKMDDFYK